MGAEYLYWLKINLTETWGQSNNFCLKLPFLRIKQDGINQIFQNLHIVKNVETLPNHLKLRNFKLVKNDQ